VVLCRSARLLPLRLRRGRFASEPARREHATRRAATPTQPSRRVEGARERHYARAMLSQPRGADGVLSLRYGRALPWRC
jgi:hypothetical protein